MKYLKHFANAQEAATILATWPFNTISSIQGQEGVSFSEGVPVGPDYSEPFYIDVRVPVTLNATSGLQMSTDGKTWVDTTFTILPAGKTYFRVASDQSSPLKPNWTEYNNLDYDIGGNINSLVKVNFENDTNCYTFYDSTNYTGFFQNKSKLKSAGDLILPATTLVNSCYDGMFNDCTSLTTAPELPATTLATGCYMGMFANCSSLTTAPALPATTLADNCYGIMFNDCTSLTTAPELPATTLATGCYMSMFNNCTNLNYIKCLATDISADYCIYDWVGGVQATGTFVKNPSMSSWPTGSDGIPSGWTVLDAA